MEAGTIRAAEVVDHIRTIRDRPDLRLDHANLRSLCKPCHDARTAREVNASRRGA
jgi:5-methylcytosine-specific restriction protein A